MWKEFTEHEAMQALQRYKVFVLTPQRRHLLGNALLNLENKQVPLQTAKMQLRGQILFNRSIIDALEKANHGTHGEQLFQLGKLKTKIEYL